MKPDPLSGRWEVREVGAPRLGAFDPEPITRRGLLIVFALLYGPGFGSATVFIARDQLFGRPDLGDVLLVVLYLVGYLLLGFFLLFYQLLNARRFSFGNDELRIRTPFGLRSIRWSEVTRARHRSYNEEWAMLHRLDLFVVRRRIGIPLSDYRKGASLLAAIRPHLPVDIERDDRHSDHELRDHAP